MIKVQSFDIPLNYNCLKNPYSGLETEINYFLQTNGIHESNIINICCKNSNCVLLFYREGWEA